MRRQLAAMTCAVFAIFAFATAARAQDQIPGVAGPVAPAPDLSTCTGMQTEYRRQNEDLQKRRTADELFTALGGVTSGFRQSALTASQDELNDFMTSSRAQLQQVRRQVFGSDDETARAAGMVAMKTLEAAADYAADIYARRVAGESLDVSTRNYDRALAEVSRDQETFRRDTTRAAQGFAELTRRMRAASCPLPDPSTPSRGPTTNATPTSVASGPPPTTLAGGVTGVWGMRWGAVRLTQNGTRVEGELVRRTTNPHAFRFQGTIQGDVLVGTMIWIPGFDTAAQACPTPEMGAANWGRFRMEFARQNPSDPMVNYYRGAFALCGAEPDMRDDDKTIGGGRVTETLTSNSINGAWNSRLGALRIRESDGTVAIDIPEPVRHRNAPPMGAARMEGRREGNRFIGYWVNLTPTPLTISCGEAKMGSGYWGAVRLEFSRTRADGPFDQYTGEITQCSDAARPGDPDTSLVGSRTGN